jgi:hypothetical protein
LSPNVERRKTRLTRIALSGEGGGVTIFWVPGNCWERRAGKFINSGGKTCPGFSKNWMRGRRNDWSIQAIEKGKKTKTKIKAKPGRSNIHSHARKGRWLSGVRVWTAREPGRLFPLSLTQ